MIGHRGAAGCAPENTLPAVRHAVEVGADAVEIDLHATRDGRLVLLHDDTVDRTTDGAGRAEDMTLEELRRLDAGHAFTPDRGRSFPFRGAGVRLPTLEEAIEAAGALPVVAEVKTGRSADVLRGLLEEGTVDGDRLLVGGSERAAVERAAGGARWRCAAEEELRPYVLLPKLGLGWLSAARAPLAATVMVPERHSLVRIVTRRFVRRAHGDGLGVYVWTVNRADDMRRLIGLGVDGLISDFPGRAGRIFDEVRGRCAPPPAAARP